MKTKLTIALCLILTITRAQTPLSYSGVVDVDSATTSAQLYDAAQIWFVENFKSANAAIQVEDKTAGKIVAKGFFEVWGPIAESKKEYYIGEVYFIMKVFVKDEKYKYEFSDFDHTYEKQGDVKLTGAGTVTDATECPEHAFKGYVLGAKLRQAYWVALKTEIDEQVKKTAAGLQTSMTTAKSSDDW